MGVDAELFLTSDAPEKLSLLRWKWLVRDLDGTQFGSGEGTTSIEPCEARMISPIETGPLGSTARGPVFVELRLEDSSGCLVAERLHVFGLDGVGAPLAGLLRDFDPVRDGDPASVETDRRSVRRTALQVRAGLPCHGRKV